MAWDFGYTKEEEAYRQQVAAFLDKELTEEIARQNWEDLGLGEEGRAFGKKLYEVGLLGWSWPVEYGGKGTVARLRLHPHRRTGQALERPRPQRRGLHDGGTHHSAPWQRLR